MSDLVVQGDSTPTLFLQGVAPDNTTAFLGNTKVRSTPNVDDLWVDSANHLLKRCTATSPYTWVSVEGGGAAINFQDAETPAGAINGVNVTFTLAFTPNPAASLELYRNGLVQLGGGVDYTLSGATITMVAAPLTGDTLRAWYRR